MLRFLGAAALALAATNPVLAQDDDDRGDRDRRGMNHSDHRGGDDDDRKDRGRGNQRADRDDDDDDRRGPAMREVREWRGDAARVRDRVERADFRYGRRGDRDDDWDDRDGRRDGWVDRERIFAAVPGCPPGLAKRNNGCLPPGIARQVRDNALGYAYRPALFGVPLRGAADYVYYDGYLIPSDTSGGGGLARYLPLLGGALAIGQLWPEAYPSLPLDDWQRDYYDFDDADAYRYADNVVYEVDPGTSAIESIVALLTGTDFAVGETLPDGYDVYNVPAAYQDRYADSDDAMYRYADGRILEVDPTSMLVEKIIELVV
jgi:hypothetical protein